MKSWIFYLWLTRPSDGLHHLIKRLPARPFLGLIGEATSPPIIFALLLDRLESFHLFFTRCFVQNIGLLNKYRGLYSVLEDSPSIFDFRCFLEQAPKLPANFLSLSISARAAEVFLPSDIFGNLQSCPKVVYIRPLVWRCSLQVIVDSCPLFYLYGRGSKVLGRTASRLWAMSWEVFSLPSIFLVLWRRRDQWAILPSLWWNLFFYSYFLMFYE